MDLLLPALLVLAGLVLLTGGGELLVRGATALAQLAGLTPAVIGLTVVAMGTSLPELVVSIIAALADQPDLTVGNVVGSNIFNTAAILGVTAMVFPLPVRGGVVRLEWPFMFVASIAALLLVRDGVLDRLEGGAFVVALVLFVAYTVHLARREVAASEEAALAEEVAERTLPRRARPVATALAVVLGGVLLLVVGGRLLVDGAVEIARGLGVSERVIGLTIVAAGTSAPELATSIVAALRRHADVAVANIVGSNIFNVLGILGLSALVTPLPISGAMIASDFWWMLGTALLILPLMYTRRQIERWEGAVLVAVYLLYVYLLL